MILISKTYEIVPAYDDPEELDYVECETGFEFEDEPHTFCELVQLLRGGEASCVPIGDNGTRVWVTHYGEQDYRDGGWKNEAYHFSRSNPERKGKYWRKALHLAGFK